MSRQWTCLGSRHDRSDFYGRTPLKTVLSDVNANILLVLVSAQYCSDGADQRRSTPAASREGLSGLAEPTARGIRDAGRGPHQFPGIVLGERHMETYRRASVVRVRNQRPLALSRTGAARCHIHLRP